MTNARYVYAIVGCDTPLPPADIVGASTELAMVPCRGLAAVTGRCDDNATYSPEAVLRHEAVVEAVRRQGRALPVRFGTVFRDATSVVSAIAERYGPLVDDLDRLGDKVELSLTALWTVPTPADETTTTARSDGGSAGSRYLLARAAELRRGAALKESARAVAEQLDHVLGPLALEQRMSLLPTPRIAVRTTYLVDPARVSEFKAAFERILIGARDLRVLLTGPWPPYSFVGTTDTESRNTSRDRVAALVQSLTDVMEGRPG
jgi:hypothetical protein